MAEGRIKWYSEDKGYGFIEAEDGNEIFFHKNRMSISKDTSDYGNLIASHLKLN